RGLGRRDARSARRDRRHRRRVRFGGRAHALGARGGHQLRDRAGRDVTAPGADPRDRPADMIPPHLEALLAACRAELGPFATHGRVLASTTSTNDDALRWAGEGAPEGAWVVAAEQRAGRG